MPTLIIVLLFGILTQTVSGLRCLSCQDISHPQFCKQTVTCAAGEVCGIEKFVSQGGDVRYSLDCVTNEICTSAGSNMTVRAIHNSNTGHIRQCLQCCHGELCNSGGCGESGFSELRKTVCFQCQYKGTSEECTTIETCNADEVCYIEETRQYMKPFFNSGCRRKNLCDALRNPGAAIGRKKREELCVHCCASSLCNDKCGQCVDHPECPYLISQYQACNDTNTATEICPKSCGNCHRQTTVNPPVTVSNCRDVSTNCAYLQSRFHICQDTSTVTQLGCHRTCGLCGSAVTMPTSTQRPDVFTDTSGKEFYFSYLQNYKDTGHLAFYVVSGGTGYFNVTIPHQSIQQTIKINSKLSIYNVSSSVMPTGLVTENKGIYIKSSTPVYMFVWNGVHHTSDGFNVLPLQHLSREYVVPSTRPKKTTDSFRSDVIVTSPYDSNNVTFHLKTSGSFTYKGNTYRSGDVLNVVLDRLETFQIIHQYALTGTRITSEKPIAVVSGNECNEFTGACSHMSDMVPPTNTYDNLFIIPKFPMQSIKLQVMGRRNQTNFQTSSSSNQTLWKVGDYTGIDLSNTTVISASDGILVTQYIYGDHFDPCMMIVPGVHQYLSNYNFSVQHAEGLEEYENYITVIIKSSAKKGLILDGNRISNSSSSVLVNNESYDYFLRPIISGYHNMRHEHGATFGLFVFGKMQDDSYAYAAGKNLKSLTN